MTFTVDEAKLAETVHSVIQIYAGLRDQCTQIQMINLLEDVLQGFSYFSKNIFMGIKKKLHLLRKDCMDLYCF